MGIVLNKKDQYGVNIPNDLILLPAADDARELTEKEYDTINKASWYETEGGSAIMVSYSEVQELSLSEITQQMQG